MLKKQYFDAVVHTPFQIKKIDTAIVAIISLPNLA